MIEHFGLKRYPFEKEIPAEEVILSNSQAMAKKQLLLVLHTKEIGFLIGEAGTGKSIVLESVAKSISQNKYKLLFLSDPQGSARYVWRYLVRQLGIETPGPDAFREFHRQLLLFQQEAARQPILLIDEAQQLRPETIDQLRLLTNPTLDNICPLVLIMTGQVELSGRLNNPSYEAFNQRVGVRYRLMPMEEDEAHKYIDFHLKRAGAVEEIFTSEAKQLIFDYTRGIPRKMNRLCLNTMIYAEQYGIEQIEVATVNLATEVSIEQ